MDVRLDDLARVAGIDRAVLAASGPHLLAGLVREHDVAAIEPTTLEVRSARTGPSSRVEYARDADADILALRPELRDGVERTIHFCDGPLRAQRALDDDVLEPAIPCSGIRGALEEALERELRLVVDEVRVLSFMRDLALPC